MIATIFFIATNLSAQTPHYIDFQKILNESTAGKKAQNELKNRLSQTIKKLDKNQKDLQSQEKQIIQQSQLLEFCIPNKKLDDLGGLDNFKAWLKQRDAAFSQSALDYGLPYPKGLLLVGVQGTGKSIAAKIIADEWKLPLLKLDFGRLFA